MKSVRSAMAEIMKMRIEPGVTVTTNIAHTEPSFLDGICVKFLSIFPDNHFGRLSIILAGFYQFDL